MKTCSLNDFMAEINPWLDKDHIRKAHLDDKGHFVLHFVDGMKNVYHIDDCNESQIKNVLNGLKSKGVSVTE
ncbi:MAG: hypothetical protein JSW69_00440 [Deltaproteobacteria bacterium]|jgi:hypothetical protein|nr:MAG: hypothetical protein JSW69_00440 [Deltaproteobacteria bacterium]